MFFLTLKIFWGSNFLSKPLQAPAPNAGEVQEKTNVVIIIVPIIAIATALGFGFACACRYVLAVA